MRETRRNNCRIIIPFFSHLRISIAIIGRRLDSIYSKFCLASSLPPLSFPLFFPSPLPVFTLVATTPFYPPDTMFPPSRLMARFYVLLPSQQRTRSRCFLIQNRAQLSFVSFFFLFLFFFSCNRDRSSIGRLIGRARQENRDWS